MGGGYSLPTGFAIMLHLLKQTLVLTSQTVILAFDAFQLHRGVTQLSLSVAPGLGRAF